MSARQIFTIIKKKIFLSFKNFLLFKLDLTIIVKLLNLLTIIYSPSLII